MTRSGYEAVFFDAGETLVHPHPTFADLFARTLRTQGIGVEVYPEAKKIGQQLTYADRRGFRLALILGPDELNNDRCKIKDLRSGEEQVVGLHDVATAIGAALQLKSG